MEKSYFLAWKNNCNRTDGEMEYHKFDQELGKPLRATDIASWLGVDIDFVRKYYRELGGVRLGNSQRGRLLFFEKHVIDAIRRMNNAQQGNQTGQGEVACLDNERRQEEAEAIQHQKESSGMGGKRTKRRLVEDKYGITGPAGMGKQVS